MRTSLHVECPIFLSNVKQTWTFWTDFRKKRGANIKFHENPSSGSQTVQYARMDMTKLSVAFRNSANSPDKFDLLPLLQILISQFLRYGSDAISVPSHPQPKFLRSETSTKFHHHYASFKYRIISPISHGGKQPNTTMSDRMLNAVPQTALTKFSLRITH